MVNIYCFSDACYVIKITYQHIEKSVLKVLLNLDEVELPQWMKKHDWKELEKGYIFITNQEEIIKTKNITENIDIESVTSVLATYR